MCSDLRERFSASPPASLWLMRAICTNSATSSDSPAATWPWAWVIASRAMASNSGISASACRLSGFTCNTAGVRMWRSSSGAATVASDSSGRWAAVMTGPSISLEK